MATVTRDELVAKRDDLKSQVVTLEAEYAGARFSEEDRERWNGLNGEIDDLDEHIKELELRAQRIGVIAGEERHVERETIQTPRGGSTQRENIYDLSTIRRSYDDPSVEGRELRDRALKAVETMQPQHPDVTKEEAQRNVERLLSTDSEDGRLARYLLAVGSPTYKRAFPKLIAQNGGMAFLDRDEQVAVQAAKHAERALSLTGASGGFAVPFELDPTILNTSNGVLNPIRQVARVIQISVDEWRGVTSTGITATYEAEATETTDNAPTLVQPTISTEKAQAFVPFSIEVGQDWNGLQSSMAELIQDAKDTLEAAKFITGTGTNEPFGVITGATNTVNATAAGVFDLEDLYRLKNSLPPRYRPRAAWMGDGIVLDKIRQFDTVGSSAAIWVDSLGADRADRLLGKPVFEASEMTDVTTVGAKFLLYGDFSRYVIVDRVGLNVEVIPHLMGANRRPTGQRGLYAYWRNGAKVVDANAFRVLLGLA
jgi:HK97 family phage major capsid protein